MRTSAAILAGAAGLTALGAGVLPATANAATLSPQAVAAQIVPANQLASFSQIIAHESSWNVTATNASSGAYGLAQALPGSKMATHGADWKTNATTQIKWALDYMNSRYGSPNAAWTFWQANHWY
ncbi:transglycosylase SLT domain-containing protein [Kitasatospora sp. NPDC057940]|uniref:aggregation-promoting factor C-terminal-like domain-containing protein n=1 Tax=Kitasatospora sp. NPDC057940 TaxID=3346285 RepID=UPI0036D8B57D